MFLFNLHRSLLFTLILQLIRDTPAVSQRYNCSVYRECWLGDYKHYYQLSNSLLSSEMNFIFLRTISVRRDTLVLLSPLEDKDLSIKFLTSLFCFFVIFKSKSNYIKLSPSFQWMIFRFLLPDWKGELYKAQNYKLGSSVNKLLILTSDKF